MTLFSLDNVVKNGKIVPDDPDDDVKPLPAPSLKASAMSVTSAPSTVVESDPDCQILNRGDGIVDVVLLQTRLPSPQDAATGKPLDPL